MLAVAISTWYYRRHKRRRTKLDTLIWLFGFRFDIVGMDFSRALNEIYIVFHDSPAVPRVLQDFHQVTVARQRELANDRLVTLLKDMCRDVGIDPASVNDSFYLQPFNSSPVKSVLYCSLLSLLKKQITKHNVMFPLFLITGYGIIFAKTGVIVWQ